MCCPGWATSIVSEGGCDCGLRRLWMDKKVGTPAQCRKWPAYTHTHTHAHTSARFCCRSVLSNSPHVLRAGASPMRPSTHTGGHLKAYLGCCSNQGRGRHTGALICPSFWSVPGVGGTWMRTLQRRVGWWWWWVSSFGQGHRLSNGTMLFPPLHPPKRTPAFGLF